MTCNTMTAHRQRVRHRGPSARFDLAIAQVVSSCIHARWKTTIHCLSWRIYARPALAPLRGYSEVPKNPSHSLSLPPAEPVGLPTRALQPCGRLQRTSPLVFHALWACRVDLQMGCSVGLARGEREPGLTLFLQTLFCEGATGKWSKKHVRSKSSIPAVSSQVAAS